MFSVLDFKKSLAFASMIALASLSVYSNAQAMEKEEDPSNNSSHLPIKPTGKDQDDSPDPYEALKKVASMPLGLVVRAKVGKEDPSAYSFLPSNKMNTMKIEERSKDAKRKFLIGLQYFEEENKLTFITSPRDLTKEIIYLEFTNGRKMTFDNEFEGSLSSGNFSINPEQVQCGTLVISRTLPLIQIANQLQNAPEIKSVVLNTTPLSPDEKYRKEIQRFNEIQENRSLSQQVIDFTRKFYTITQQYEKEGSKLAKKSLSEVQADLGIKLVKFQQNQGNNLTSPLREAVQLLEISASFGNETAIRNVPKTNYLLGISLLNSMKDEKGSENIPLLREALHFMNKAKGTGITQWNKEFALAEYFLARNLYLTIFPDQSANKTLDSNDVLILKEAHDLFISAKIYYSFDEKPLFHIQSLLPQFNLPLPSSTTQQLPEKLFSLALDSKAQESKQVSGTSTLSPIELPQELAKAIEDSKTGKAAFWKLPNLIKEKEIYRKAEYLPVYVKLLENPQINELTKSMLIEYYPHPELICSYLLYEKTGLYINPIKQVVKDKEFMKEKGFPFFMKLITKTKKSLPFECERIFRMLIEEKSFTVDDMIILLCEIMKNENLSFFLGEELISLLVKLPDYESNIHGIKIAKSMSPENSSEESKIKIHNYNKLLALLGLKS